MESEPSYYLGTSLTVIEDGQIKMHSEKYIKESIRKYETQHNITLKKEPIPMKVDSHPELDDSPLLDLEEHKEYHISLGSDNRWY